MVEGLDAYESLLILTNIIWNLFDHEHTYEKIYTREMSGLSGETRDHMEGLLKLQNGIFKLMRDR